MSLTGPSTQTLRRLPVRRMLIVTPLVAIALSAAVIGARARVPDNQIVPGVHVGELDLGGKSLEEARPLLEQWAARKQAMPVVLRFTPESGKSKTWKPDAAKIGLTINVANTLDAAAKAGREDIAGQVTHIFSGTKAIHISAIPTVDESRLKAYLKRQIAADVNRKPKNAQFVLIRGGGFGTRHDEPGRALDVETSAVSVTQAWTGFLATAPAAPTAGSHTETGKGGETPPATSAEKDTAKESQETVAAPAEGLEALLSVKSTAAAITSEAVGQIDSVLGAKTSYVNGTTSRLSNIRIAARHINGTLLKSGEVFSYNKIVGPRDEDEGYREAPILVQGKHDTGIAGGICQTSGTLFNAVLASGLQIVERSNHSAPIGYLPFGLDATVSYGSLDLKFKNDTSAPVYVAAVLNGRALTFSLFGKHTPGRKVALVRGGSSRYGGSYVTRHDRSKPAGYRRVVEPGSGGAHATWYRIIKENGKVVHRDVISSHYSGHTGVVVIGTGAPRARANRRSTPGASGSTPNVTPGSGSPAPPAPSAGAQL